MAADKLKIDQLSFDAAWMYETLITTGHHGKGSLPRTGSRRNAAISVGAAYGIAYQEDPRLHQTEPHEFSVSLTRVHPDVKAARTG